MCIVCVEWNKGNLTSKEAMRNLGEMIGMKGEADLDPDIRHYYEAVEKILDKEVPLSDTNEELDSKWHRETRDGDGTD